MSKLLRRYSRDQQIRDSSLNILGFGLPLASSLYAMPILLKAMGPNNFGWLVLTWTMIGYFGLFDLGISRALTFMLSKERASKLKPNSTIAWSGLTILLFLGIAAGVAVKILTTYIPVFGLFAGEDPQEVDHLTKSIAAITVALPFVLLSSGFSAVLEAFQQFKILNIIKSLMGVSLTLLPIPVYLISRSVESIVLCICLSRILFSFVYGYFACRNIARISKYSFKAGEVRKFFSYGKWIALSNTIGPIMLYGDRFILASTGSVALAGFYGSINDILTKLLIIPASIASAFFPEISSNNSSSTKCKRMLFRSLKISIYLLAPCLIMVIILGPLFSSNFMGGEFNQYFLKVLPILLFGLVSNSLGIVSQSYVQALNRPDLTGKLQIIEFLFFIPYAVILIKHFSIQGAALAWTIRTTISFIALFTIANLIKGKNQ